MDVLEGRAYEISPIPLSLLMCPYVQNEQECRIEECPFQHNKYKNEVEFGMWKGRKMFGCIGLEQRYMDLMLVECDTVALKNSVMLCNKDKWRSISITRAEFSFLLADGRSRGPMVPGLQLNCGGKCLGEDGVLSWAPGALEVKPGEKIVVPFTAQSSVVGAIQCRVTFIDSTLGLTSLPLLVSITVVSRDDAALVLRVRTAAAPYFPKEVRDLWAKPAKRVIGAPPPPCVEPVATNSICYTPVEFSWAFYNGFVPWTTIEQWRKDCTDPLLKGVFDHGLLGSYDFMFQQDKHLGMGLKERGEKQFRTLLAQKDLDPLLGLQAMLLLEEMARDATARTFDAFFVPITWNWKEKLPKGAMLASLEIPGASEKRPHLLYGDCLRVRVHVPGEGMEHLELHARVLSIRGTTVTVSMRTARDVLPQLPSKVHIKFVWNRMGFRRMHLALLHFGKHPELSAAFDPNKLSVPSTARRRLQVGDFECQDPRLSSEQKSAVACMLSSSPKAGDPFIIIEGSAGSGKTETIVEMVRQAVRAWGPATRVLLCAPSNGAADVLALRLLEGGVLSMLRLNAHQRALTELLGGGRLLPHCFVGKGSNLHDMPPLDVLLSFNVIVATCVCSGWIRERYGAAYCPNLIVVDEAAQALTPELLIPISMAGPVTRAMVLCGDPKQLGPAIHSSEGSELGGFLEKLLENPFYARGGGKSFHIQLTRNYRTHPELLALSSRLFYKSAVHPCWNPIEANRLLGFEDVAHSAYPCAFYGIVGVDERDGDSPSFLNWREALEVVRLVKHVLSSKAIGARTGVFKIGVVTPFYQQVRLIRRLLRENDLRDIRVGSIEDYQGQEESVLIVSCVRSSHRWIAQDKERGLGLLFNNRQFNVCITRPRNLLLIVGNPYILTLDPNWRHLIGETLKRETYTGVPFDVTWCDASNAAAHEDQEVEEDKDIDLLAHHLYTDDQPWDARY